MSTSTARAAIFETLQVGIEDAAAPGTPVAANLKFPHTKMMPKLSVPTEDVNEQGGKGPTDVIVGKEMTTFTGTGMVNAGDLLYFVASAITRPTFAANVGTMQVNQYGPDDKLTMTFEMGGERGRSRTAGVQVKSVEIKLSPDKAPNYTVNLFGRKFDETIVALTTNPTRLLTSPFGPKGVSVYIADTLAGLDTATNKLDKAMLLDATLKIENMVSELFGIEDTDTYTDTVEDKPAVSLAITVQQNSRADGVYVETALGGANVLSCSHGRAYHRGRSDQVGV